MIRLTVTGGIACGKSLVCESLGVCGARICSADTFAHEALQTGSKTYQEVVDVFGEQFVATDGSILRRELGRYVFSHPKARDRLEALVHAPVKARIQQWMAEGGPNDVCVAEVPLLFEAGMDGLEWDAVICVVAPVSVQLERLARRGLTPAEAQTRISVQMSTEEKAARADYVIINATSKTLAKEQTEQVWNRLLETRR